MYVLSHLDWFLFRIIRYYEPDRRAKNIWHHHANQQGGPATNGKSQAGAIGNTLDIELLGELSALISSGIRPKHKHPLADAEGVQVTLVAGAGFFQGPTIRKWI